MFKPKFKDIALFASILGLTCSMQGSPITVPNASFEGPPVSPTNSYFAEADIDSWQKTPQPAVYDTNTQGSWYAYTGEFVNSPFTGAVIDNVDGSQAAFVYGYPEAGFFQDYDSIGGTNSPVPTHAFDATYHLGKSYRLTAGFTLSYYQPPPQGSGIALQLYYRDASSNIVVVASTTVTNDPAVFNPVLHLYDFSTQTPVGTASSSWVGKKIGIQFIYASDLAHAGGYWDFDNVRLTEITPTQLTNPVRSTNGQFGFTIISEPGLAFQVLTSTNPATLLANWFVLGTVTNTTGTLPFTDTLNTNSATRFYSARQL